MFNNTLADSINLIRHLYPFTPAEIAFKNLSESEKADFHRYLYLVKGDFQTQHYLIKIVDTKLNTIKVKKQKKLKIPLTSKIRVGDPMLAHELSKEYPFAVANHLVYSFFE